MILANWPRAASIGLGALVLSTLAIQASDELQGISSNYLSGSVVNSGKVCDADSVLVAIDQKQLCIDSYEASPSADCIYLDPQSEQDTLVNVATPDCIAKSQADVLPWRYVTYTQAKQLCARTGKRLLTNKEWYQNALSISDSEACLATGVLTKTGSNTCSSHDGIHDLIGNVWEWTEENVTDGIYENRTLPESGYVSLVDGAGIVIETAAEPDTAFQKDYAWVDKEGVRGILRGGFYGSGEDGGIFAQNLSVPLNFATAGVGFRCVRDIL